MGTAEQRGRFVENLRALMDQRGLTVRELARRANVADIKRLHRWTSKGISRAHHEHEDDLERLRAFFGLTGIGQFWREKPHQSLAERLREAGRIEGEYEYAYKLLIVLKASGGTGPVQLKEAIDGLYRRATLEEAPETILQPRDAEQIANFIEINHHEAFQKILGLIQGGRAGVLTMIRESLREKPMEPLVFVDVLLRQVWRKRPKPDA